MNRAAAQRIGLLTLMACTALAARAAEPPVYVSDEAQSRLEFKGTQAGAEFTGQFKKFSATVAFAPENPAAGHIDVQIDLNSLDSQDADRDKTMRGPEFFDVAHSPVAHYTIRSIAKSAAGYTANGTLTLRGVTKDVPIEFKFVPGAGGAKLEGDAKLRRLDFGVGQGEWKSTEWVGNDVKVHFALVLKPKA